MNLILQLLSSFSSFLPPIRIAHLRHRRGVGGRRDWELVSCISSSFSHRVPFAILSFRSRLCPDTVSSCLQPSLVRFRSSSSICLRCSHSSGTRPAPAPGVASSFVCFSKVRSISIELFSGRILPSFSAPVPLISGVRCHHDPLRISAHSASYHLSSFHTACIPSLAFLTVHLWVILDATRRSRSSFNRLPISPLYPLSF